jgi:hypothetical protein
MSRLLVGATILSCTLFSATVSAEGCEILNERIRRAPLDLNTGLARVVVQGGTYECREPVVIDRSDLELIGEGRPLLRLLDGANAPVLVIGSVRTTWGRAPQDFVDQGMSRDDLITPIRVRNVRVSGFDIDGNMENQQWECWASPNCDSSDNQGRGHIRNNGITVRGASDVLISDVDIKRARSGGIVTEKHVADLVIEDTRATENFFDGFAGYQTIRSVFRRVDLSQNHHAGVSLDLDFNGNTFVDSKFNDNGHPAVFIRMSRSNLFDRVEMDRNGLEFGAPAFFIAQNGSNPADCVFDTVIRSSSITRSRGIGLRVNDAGCTGTKVIATTFEGNGGENISLAPGATIEVSE